ncbi:MAG: DUF2007 domain-containing protein [Verrucomicrobiales bacterium]|nr:DUF2007 domain-containing protein [Verrucomicrobiales bacterium]
MVILKSYTHAEEAYVAAAFLSSEGVEAVVVDEHAIGGNLLGAASPGSIRIEVVEADLEKAEMLLRESEQAEDLHPTAERLPILLPQPSAQDYRIVTTFRALIYTELVVFLLTSFFPSIYGPTPPQDIQQYLDGLALSQDSWFFAYSFWPIHVSIVLLSSLLMLTMITAGRWVYLLSVVTGLLLFWGPPPYIGSAAGNTVASLQWILAGAIATMSFLEPVSKYFRNRFTVDPGKEP